MNLIDINELTVVNYCHPHCKPFQNIMRLPKQQAYDKAKELSEKNPESTAFYRFGDFENYYPLRLKADELLYSAFIKLGGKPKQEHPLSFVLQGSDYLDNWFGNGTITKIPLKDICSESVSFTYGDSCAVFQKTGELSVITKEMLLEEMGVFSGTIDDYIKQAEKKHGYIEVQIWTDDIVKYLYKKLEKNRKMGYN